MFIIKEKWFSEGGCYFKEGWGLYIREDIENRK